MCIWLVGIGTVMSAFWILSANSFMQHPVGVKYVENNVIGTKAEMVDFFAIIKNPYLWNQFPHVITMAITVGGFTNRRYCSVGKWFVNMKLQSLEKHLKYQ